MLVAALLDILSITKIYHKYKIKFVKDVIKNVNIVLDLQIRNVIIVQKIIFSIETNVYHLMTPNLKEHSKKNKIIK